MLDTILKEKLIVIVRNVKKEQLLPLAQALYDGGIRLLEVTFGAAGDRETAESIRMLAEHFAGKMSIGAGTVLTPRQVALTKKAGGKFIISPNADKAVIRKAKAMGLVSIPGAMTPTEIQTAHRAGADIVKLFPAAQLGTDYLKAVSAPLPHIRYLAVGGIDETNAAEYLQNGACGVGIGNSLVNKAWIEAGEFGRITALAKEYIRQVQP